MGTWERTNGKPGTETYETWKKINPTTYEGISVVLKDNDTVYKESCTIKLENETYYYIADVPQNENPVKFEIKQLKENSFYSENAKHDFPKSISYDYEDGIITAYVSGSGRRITYLFEKTK